MAGYHGKSFSTCQLFTCIFTAQVSPFLRQFAKQIHMPIYLSGGEAVGVGLEKVGGPGEHWEKQIFSLAWDGTVKTHSRCWCVLEVSQANISTALQWQSGGAALKWWEALLCICALYACYTTFLTQAYHNKDLRNNTSATGDCLHE